MNRTSQSINPYTEATIGEYALFSDTEIDARLDRAVIAQRDWRKSAMATRAATLRAVAGGLEARREELAELATAEMGKLISEARGEVDKCAWVCRYYADHAEGQLADEALDDDGHRKSFLARDPLGVVLAIMPWNFPYWQAFRCAAPALMAGNTVLLKHASNVTGCALAMEQLFAATGADTGLFQTLICSGSRASELIGDNRIAGASITGSETAGRAVGEAAGRALKPSVLELGGSDPFVVLDLDHEAHVLDNAVQSRFMNSGQSCIAAKRFIVVREVYDRFVEGFVERASQRQPGDPLEDETMLAPMARGDLRDELGKQVEDARANGAEVALGGEIPDQTGFFYPATVLLNVTPSARAYSEELFGPAATLYRADSVEEAIALANDSAFGLGGSVWSGNAGRALEVARQIESGAVYVNRMMASDPRLPFGGIGISGYGRELSHLGIREFVNEKTISVDLAAQ